MEHFSEKLAVITGGGSGIGRELARQLSAQGCHTAFCDLSRENMEQTQALCERDAAPGTRITHFEADVSDEQQLLAFRDAVVRAHDAQCIHLLFNNAGIGGAGSMVADSREEWDKTFAVCWNGVYYGTRVFLPLLLKSPEGHIVNTSSVCGFWASLGPNTANTAYSAAKFAVKGFTEALVGDFRNFAPHLKASVVMPGHIGTSIIVNSGRVLGRPQPKDMSDAEVEEVKRRMKQQGMDLSALAPDDIRRLAQQRVEDFASGAPTSAADAAREILEGVRAGRWRILVGDDARVMDEMVRAEPEQAYEVDFMERLVQRTNWSLGA